MNDFKDFIYTVIVPCCCLLLIITLVCTPLIYFETKKTQQIINRYSDQKLSFWDVFWTSPNVNLFLKNK
jgi:hypothetical protein